jgi:hypothetical protein
MKLYIGPYKSHWRTYLLEKKWIEYNHGKSYYEVQEHELTKTDRRVERFLDNLQIVFDHTINRIIDRMSRKTKIVLHDYDTWNMDNTLAMIIVPMLKQLRDSKHGSPYVDDEDVPDHLRPTKGSQDDQQRNIEERWDWVINEMILAFEAELDHDWEDQFSSGEIDYSWIKDEHGNSSQVTGPNHTYKIDLEGLTARNERNRNGRILFAKYYCALWD